MKKFLMFFVCLLAMPAIPSVAHAQLQVPIIAQPAEWTGMAVYPGGTRTNAPVTFGLGIPNSAGIDCPGTQDFPQNEQAPTKLSLYNGATKLNSQFRCMAKWPDGKAEWVLVDAQLPSFTDCQPSCTGTAGYDTSITVKQVSSGGGNFPATSMAVQCTGSGTPVPACPDGNHILVNTTAATFLIKEANYNLFDDVQAGSTHLISETNHGNNDGLILFGPPASATGIDSVSCVPTANGSTALSGSSGPIPTNYGGASVCGTPYRSNQDSASTCLIEENGPLRSVVMCQGSMVNGSTPYLQWRTRTHFWYQHSDAKVTVALRNAIATNPNVINVSTAYREFQQFEERLTDNLGATRNYDISTAAGNASGTGFTSSEYAYLFQGHSTNGAWPHWDAAGGNNCQHESDGCVVSYIPRSGTVSSRQYSLDGWQVNQNSATPSTVGPNSTFPVGWFDLDDGTNGIETGVYQFSMYWPKSLEAQPLPSGATSGNEIRIGVWPNMQEAISGAGSPVFGANTIQNPGYSATGDSQPIASYVIGYPQYQIHDTYWNFHSGTQSAAIAQQNFLYFQQYMLARPQSPTYYNTVTDSASGFPALFYNIPDPVAEDQLYINMGACSQTPGQCLGDVGMTSVQGYPFQFSYAGMKVFRYFGWPAAGGSDGTQFEQRDSFLRNFLQRGCTPSGTSCAGASLTGSTPGRYIFAAHFYRMVVEKTLPRSDGTPTSGASAGFRQYCTPYTLTCQQSEGFSNWGDPHPVNLTPATSWMNGGMRNWGDDINEMDHSTYWGIFDYYHLSGDEWMKEQLLQGFKDRYENPWVQYNNPQANVTGGNNAAGHGHINAIRAIGHHLSGMAREADFLCSIGDPDCDTKANLTSGSPSIPGAAVGSTTPLESALNILSTAVVIPFISGGYPQGFAEAIVSGVNCRQNSGAGVGNCSQGISPTRGFPRAAGSGENCTIPWKSNAAESLGQTIVDTNANLEQVTTAGTTGSGSHPSWNATTGGATFDSTVVWTNQGPATGPCNNTDYRAADSFQQGIEAEGIYDVWQELRKIMGPDWHINVGTASGGSPILDGGTSLSNVLVSEKNLVDALGLIGLQMHDGNCVSGGNYTNSGCVYTQAADYLNAQNPPAPNPGPGCLITGNCLRTTTAGASACTAGCNGLNEWFGIAGAALATNSIFNPDGTPWQFFLNTQLTGGQVVQELGSHMMQHAMSYVLANGSTSNSTAFTLNNSVPALTSVPITITGCTGAGCVAGTNLCSFGSAPGTCTITWTAPSGICTVGINCPPNNAPNGQQYRLKYWYCTTGVLTILGNDCPAGGKTIQPDLGFREDILTAGTVATDGFGTQVGSSTYDPAHNWNLFASIDVPDCGNGTSTTGCNSAPVSGTSYTFNGQAHSTYNFYLGAYQTGSCSGVTLTPSAYDFNSSVLGIPSSDSPQTFTLNNCTASTITSVTPSVTGTNSADFAYTIPGSGGCGSTLAASASCTIRDSFTPSIVGAETATLNVSYGGGGGGGGTIVPATSCSASAVQAALNSTGAGTYTVTIPAGACNWTSTPVSINPTGNLTIKGATVCTGSGCAPGSGGVGLSASSFGDTTTTCNSSINTCITMQAGDFTIGSSGINCSAANFCDISGITFLISNGVQGAMTVRGTHGQVSLRVHHLHMIDTGSSSQVVLTESGGYGLNDHIVFDDTATATTAPFNFFGDFSSLGYQMWEDTTNPGTNQSFYVEDSVENNVLATDEGFFDAYAGCKVVIRHNIINGNQVGGGHGTDSGGYRGCVSYEIYNNQLTNNTAQGEAMIAIRSGTMQFFNNVVLGSTPYGRADLQFYRIQQCIPYTSGCGVEAGTWGIPFAGVNYTPIKASQGTNCSVSADCSTVDTLNASDWVGNHAYAANAYIGPLTNNAGHFGSGYNFVNTGGSCTSANVAESTITWTQTVGQTTSDGACTWLNVGGALAASPAPGVSAGWCAANPDTPSTSNATCNALSSGDTASRYTDANGGVRPFRDQECFGHNQVSMPCYAWGNSGSNLPSPVMGTDSNTTSVVISGTDFFNGTVNPSYTPYTYPHPLTGGSGGNVSAALSGDGFAVGSLTLTPASRTFATAAVGDVSSDSPVTFTLTNNSSAVVTAISISIAGADSSDYSALSPATTCGPSLAITASCQIYVSFAPLATGVRVATLSISDSDPGSPQTAGLSGTAIPPVINPTPSNPITFGVLVTDPSILSTVKNENQKQYDLLGSAQLRGRDRVTKQWGLIFDGCPVLEMQTQLAESNGAEKCAPGKSRRTNSAYNFDHIDLRRFLRQERPGYAARSSAR